MTDPAPTNIPQLTATAPTSATYKKIWLKISLVFVVVVLAILGVAWHLQPQLLNIPPQTSSPLPIEGTATKEPDAAPQGSKPPAPPLAVDLKLSDLEKNVVTLSATVEVLHNELEQKNALLEKNHVPGSMNLAVVIAFFQLKDQALSGRHFKNEYEVLSRLAAGLPETFQTKMRQLEPLADMNIPTRAALYDQLRQIEPQAEHAIRKAQATNWSSRIKAELDTLVTVRHLNSATTPNLFQPIEKAFSDDDFAALPARIEQLPPPAQLLLAAWSHDVENINHLSNLLHDMTAELINLNTGPSAPKDSIP